jgi:hypothetical protein
MPSLNALRVSLLSCQILIWLAAWIVPRGLRRHWKEMWLNKSWHWANFLAETGRLNRANQLTLLRHCCGAFEEAFWLRFEREAFLSRADRHLRSPATCLVACFVVLLASALLAGIRNPVRLFSSPVAQPHRLAVVGFQGKYVRLRSETLLYLGSIWKASPLAQDLSLYSWSPSRLSDGFGEVFVVESRVAPEFFSLIGVPPELGRVPQAGSGFECADCAVLGHDFWQMHFHGDRNVIGRTIEIDGHPKTVIGVLPNNVSIPAPSTAVWTVLDEATLRFSNFMGRLGAVARLPDGVSPSRLQTDLLDRSENVGYRFVQAPMSVTTWKRLTRERFWGYTSFFLLAWICAGFIAWVLRSGSGRFGSGSKEGQVRLRWWAFFLAKSIALTGTAFVPVWILMHRVLGAVAGTIYPMADEIALWAFLPAAVAALSWSIADQQKRCRVCLSRLALPVDVGRPGSVLLNFAGTEMVCVEGHGVLYVPESQRNSLERDRWSRLDDSWAELFRDE